jgi:hypothetical protein
MVLQVKSETASDGRAFLAGNFKMIAQNSRTIICITRWTVSGWFSTLLLNSSLMRIGVVLLALNEEDGDD